MAKHIKYTKELLENAVKNSVSLMGVMRFLGLRIAGGTHYHLSKKIKAFEIDTSHFLGKASNRGHNHKGGWKKKNWQDVLILRDEKQGREKSYILRRALIEYGFPYVCSGERCVVGGVWFDKKIVLAVHHINGNEFDCRPENLIFHCPNCHSQTDNYCRKKCGGSPTA